MKSYLLAALAPVAAGLCVSCGDARLEATPEARRLTASIVPSGFKDGHDSHESRYLVDPHPPDAAVRFCQLSDLLNRRPSGSPRLLVLVPGRPSGFRRTVARLLNWPACA